jgi:hypothetical protein
MSDSVFTKKGTELPLLNLKGKKYLMIAYRIQWMNEEVKNFQIDTEFLSLTEDQTIAKATVVILDENDKVLRRVSATKRETKKDFSDHTEKAETAAIGRALALLGFGTQFALSDLEEGNRLADSPLESTKKEVSKATPVQKTIPTEKVETKEENSDPTPEVPKKNSFRKPKTTPVITPAQEEEWS